MASCSPQESQGILHHTVGSWPWPLLWLQICKYAIKRQRAGSAGQRAEPQGQLPSTPPSFRTCQSQSHSPRSMHTRRVTNIRSPSALRCHHTVREQKIRYETGWWLGYLTISGLGTLTALQITSNFAGDDCMGCYSLHLCLCSYSLLSCALLIPIFELPNLLSG